jgi:hypothetical protein
MLPLKAVPVSPDIPSKRAWLICLTIVCVALGVRLLQWQNNFLDLDKNMTSLTIPVRIEQGRLAITVRPTSHPKILASAALPDSLERVPYTRAYVPDIHMPFVNTNRDQVQLAIANVDSPAPRAIVEIGRAQLVELGPASYLWTRYPRMLVKTVQKLFVTRYFLPLTILGVVILAVYRRKVALAVILTLPLYYLSSHAPIHFEYGYILPVYFFWFILAGLAIYWVALTVRSLVLALLPSQRPVHG